MIAQLEQCGAVHPDTPDAFRLRGRSSRRAKERALAAVAKAKTGDVVLFENKDPSPIAAAFVKLQRSVVDSEHKWTHAGIVLRISSSDKSGAVPDRLYVMESTLAPLEQGCDVIEGATASRLNGSIRIFPLVERAFAYEGSVSLLPLRESLSSEAEDRMLRAATAVWRSNPDFDVEQLVAAGIDRVPLVNLLTGSRSEPEEDLDAFFCSELVGHLLEVAGVFGGNDVNVSNLAPNDLLNFKDAFAVEDMQPIRTLLGKARKVMDVERHHLRVDDPRALVARLRTGDVVLVHGSHTFGSVIRVADGFTRWDHVAVVVKVPDDPVALAKRNERLLALPLPPRSSFAVHPVCGRAAAT